MTQNPKGWRSRGYLPHYDSPDMVQHIVFRTAGSLPRHVLEEFSGDSAGKAKAIEAELDRGAEGCVFVDPDAAAIVEETLLHFDGERYRLYAWCVMPNHVHVLAELHAGFSTGDIVKSWKTFSQRK